MASFRKTAWCVRCNEQRPYRRAVFGKRRAWACISCGEEVQLPRKYPNRPTASKFTALESGKPRVFHSQHEANREPVLLAMQNANVISDLRYQVPFRLEVYGNEAVERLLAAIVVTEDERPGMLPMIVSTAAAALRRAKLYVGTYIADFAYYQGGNLVVEDPKGKQTRDYRLKKALMVAAHNIEIIEPNNRGVEQRARGAGIRGRGTGSRFKGGR